MTAAMAILVSVAACGGDSDSRGEAQSDLAENSAEATGLACDLFSVAEVRQAIGFEGPIFEKVEEQSNCRWDDGKHPAALAEVEISDALGPPPATNKSPGARMVHIGGAMIKLRLDIRDAASFDVLSALITPRVEGWIAKAEPLKTEDLVRSLSLSLQRMMHQWDAISCAGVAQGDLSLNDVFDGNADGFDAVYEATQERGCGSTAVIAVQQPTSLETGLANGLVVARVATQRDNEPPVYWSANFVETATGWKLDASEGNGPLVPYCSPPGSWSDSLPVAPGCER